jgi:hypothetical protein
MKVTPRVLVLCLVLLLAAIVVGYAFSPPSHADEVRQAFVRVTYYSERGRMFDGELVHDGAAACSQWLPLGTVLEFSDGRQVTCEDRGHGDWYWAGWVDIWGDQSINQVYGDYAYVSIARWGW